MSALISSNKENLLPSNASAPDSSRVHKRVRNEDEAQNIYTRGPPKKQHRTDPLVHHGRHFGRTIRTFCRIQPLIKNGMVRTMQLELDRISEAELSQSELNEHNIYQQLLGLSPGLEERLCTGSEQDIFYVADMITKGSSAARSDDTKSLKSVIIDWITPRDGCLIPPIQRNVKSDRGFHHPRTGELLCPVNLDWNDLKIRRELETGQLIPTGDLWPRFLYRGHEYNPRKPWEGLFRGGLLVSGYKHVFTSPSSVGDRSEIRATRSSNARIHGMQTVTIPSIAYIATQIRFALSSTSTFCWTDTVTDSEFFYNLVVELLEDPEERPEVDDLLKWWNREIFPTYISESRSIHKDSVIAQIKEQRRLNQAIQDLEATQSSNSTSQSSDGSGSSTGLQTQ